jgi:hypothetical protein
MKMAVSARTIVNRAPSLRWQVLIAVPPCGFGPQLAIMRAWLDHSCGPSDWAAAPAGFDGVINDAVAFYFADRQAACAFVERFSCGYRVESRDKA